LNIETVGQHRFRVVALHTDQDYLAGAVELFPLAGARGRPARHLARVLAPWLSRYITMLGEAAEAQFERRPLPADPAALAYLAAIVAQIPMAEKQQLLEADGAVDLLQRERIIYRREISLLRAMLSSSQARDTAAFSPN